MKIFNWLMVALMVASGVVIHITRDSQLFEDDPVTGKLAAAVFLFSLLALLRNLGVFEPGD